MNTYKFNDYNLNNLTAMIDAYLKNQGLNGIYLVLGLLKQINSKEINNEFYLIKLEESHLNNLKIIFDVNLKTHGINIYKDLSSIITILDNPENSEEIIPENIE